MDKKEENNFLDEPIHYIDGIVKSEKEETEARMKLLERKVNELHNMIVLLQERITYLERSNYRNARGPSFFTGDPFIFPPEQG
jgi:hypothetical protein